MIFMDQPLYVDTFVNENGNHIRIAAQAGPFIRGQTQQAVFKISGPTSEIESIMTYMEMERLRNVLDAVLKS